MPKNRTVNKRNDTSQKAKSLNQPRKTPKAATQGSYKGIDYESLEELAFLQWAFEVKRAGFILSIKRSSSYLLCNGLVHNWVQALKSRSKPMQQTILHGHSYTPEFEIEWSKQAVNRFVWVPNEQSKFDALFVGAFNEGRLITIVEIKPMWDQNNMERLFKVNQKWMWERHQIFVNLIKPQKLFEITFTPLEYKTTPSGRPRKISWTIKTLSQFLNSRSHEKGINERRKNISNKKNYSRKKKAN